MKGSNPASKHELKCEAYQVSKAIMGPFLLSEINICFYYDDFDSAAAQYMVRMYTINHPEAVSSSRRSLSLDLSITFQYA
jgi:hypothetical protein